MTPKPRNNSEFALAAEDLRAKFRARQLFVVAIGEPDEKGVPTIDTKYACPPGLAAATPDKHIASLEVLITVLEETARLMKLQLETVKDIVAWGLGKKPDGE